MSQPTIDITFDFDEEIFHIRKCRNGHITGWKQGIDFPNALMDNEEIGGWLDKLFAEVR